MAFLLCGCLLTACSNSTNSLTPARLAVTPDTVLSLVRFDSVQLNVSALDADGHLLTGVAVEFHSSDPTIVTVSNVGLVRSVGPLGVANVTVTGGGLTQQVHVTVTAVPVAVLVTPPDTTILQRRSVQLSARAVDNTGQTVPSTFMWMSSDASLASVSATGLVTSIGQVGTVIISARTGSVTGSATVRIQDTSFVATVPLGGRAFGVAVSSHDVAYVTNLDANALARFDLPAYVVSGSVPVGQVPTSVTFTSSGATAFVADQLSQNVGVIDVATNTLTNTIPLNANPSIVLVSPDGKLLWVTTNVGGLYGIDLSTGSVTHTFTFAALSNGLAFHPLNDSLLYASVIDGTVKEINFKRDTVLRTFTIGVKPQGIAVAPDGSELYVADEGANQLRVVNIASGNVTRSVILPGGPFDLQLSRDGSRIWVSIHTGDVRVFDRATLALMRTIATGGVPRRIAFNQAGTVAVIANEGGWVDFVR